MYKIISILAFLVFLCCFNDTFAINVNTNFDLEDEEYVNDIPFNTSDVIGLDLDTNNGIYLPEKDFENKLMVINNVMNVNFDLEEEEYVDDIPFITEDIADVEPVYLNSSFQNLMNVEFNLAEEKYVDDIPFNTCEVIKGIRP